MVYVPQTPVQNPTLELPAGTGASLGFLETPFNWFSDAFSAQDATTPRHTTGDYVLGGSEQNRDAILSSLGERGDENYKTLSVVGGQEWSALNNQAAGIGKAAGQARDAGIAQSGAAHGYADAASKGYSNAPTTYGDRQTLGSWRGTAAGLRDFAPSSAVSGVGNRLAGYDAGNVDARLGDSYAALQSYAAQGPGPSAAEAQLGSALDRNVAAQAALAKSGRGAGANTNAMRQAAFTAADLGQRTASDLATLRANEAAAWRSQQLQALGAAGGVAGNIESSAQGRQGLGLQGMTSGAGILSGQDELGLNALQAASNQYGNMYGAQAGATQAAAAAKQGYLNSAIGAQQGAAAQSAGAYDDYLSGLGTAAGLTGQAGQTRLGALQAATGSRSAYDEATLGSMEAEAQRRTGLQQAYMGAATNASLGNQRADLEKDSSGVGMIGGLLGMAGLGIL